jgi:hypothetical protein
MKAGIYYAVYDDKGSILRAGRCAPGKACRQKGEGEKVLKFLHTKPDDETHCVINDKLADKAPFPGSLDRLEVNASIDPETADRATLSNIPAGTIIMVNRAPVLYSVTESVFRFAADLPGEYSILCMHPHHINREYKVGCIYSA